MYVDPIILNQKLQAFPDTYLSLEEQQAIDMILDCIRAVFGFPILPMDRTQQIEFVREIIQSLIKRMNQ